MQVTVGVYKYVEEMFVMEDTEEMRFLRDRDYDNSSLEEQCEYDDAVDRLYNELVNKGLITGEICRLYLDDVIVGEW